MNRRDTRPTVLETKNGSRALPSTVTCQPSSYMRSARARQVRKVVQSYMRSARARQVRKVVRSEAVEEPESFEYNKSTPSMGHLTRRPEAASKSGFRRIPVFTRRRCDGGDSGTVTGLSLRGGVLSSEFRRLEGLRGGATATATATAAAAASLVEP